METTATVKLVLDSREKEESRKQLKIRVTFLLYLVNCTTQKSIDNKIRDVIKRINKGLESISGNLNLWKLTTYHARHTYGAHAQSVLSAEQLQKFFGHTSSRTTQTYLQSISRSVRDKNRELLERIVPK